MDRNTARDLLLGGFKPKEKQDFPTPYLTLPDGKTLDGELKLVGLSGKERWDLEEQCLDQSFAADGKAINKVNNRKFAALCIAKCVRMRDSGEPLLDLADVLGEKGDGSGELLSMDSDAYTRLAKDVAQFIGNKSPSEIKTDLKKTDDDLGSTLSLPVLAEPSMNSSEPLAATS